MALRMIILGRQGSGKGTQAARIAEEYEVPHISTGDMLRAAVEPKGPSSVEKAKVHHGCR